MRLDVRRITILLIVSGVLLQGACGVSITASGGDAIRSGSDSIHVEAAKNAAINSQITIDGADVEPATTMSGPIPLFEETHSVKDSTGKRASVYVKVVNAPGGLTYVPKVLPKEGTVAAQSWVSAEQWLTVPKADSIKCTASASYGAWSENVGLEEVKGSSTGDYVTLTEYYGKAYASAKSVSALQTAKEGTGNSIKIYGSAKDSSGLFSVSTSLKGISGGRSKFRGLNELASSETTQVTQKEHTYNGGFSSTASFTPKTGSKTAKTRTSNYGTEYYLSMKAVKGSSPTGTVGYYVNPSTSANRIQGAVNAAQSGDTINVAPGKYIENVKIDKTLVVKGSGAGKTVVDGNKKGSVFTIGKSTPSARVTLSGMTIQRGSGTSITTKYGTTGVCGGGVINYGKLAITDSTVSGNSAGYLAGGIYNVGTLTATNSIISKNSASWGGAMYNWGTVTVKGSTISENAASNGGGGVYSCCSSITTVIDSKITGNSAKTIGGGFAAQGTLAVKGSSVISKNTASKGGAISWKNKRPSIDSSVVITGNSKPQIDPS